MAKISWTDHVRSEEVLQRVMEERNILQTIKRRKANWIGHFLRRNCRLKHVIELYKGQEDDEEDVSSYWMTLQKRGDTRNRKMEALDLSHSVDNSLWKRLWTCRKTDYGKH